MFDKVSLFERFVEHLVSLIDNRSITPSPVRVFPMDKIADAHRAIESAQTVGKLVMATKFGEQCEDLEH